MIMKIQDKHLFERAKSRLQAITDGPYNLQVSLVRQKGWQVGVLEGADYFRPDRARMFADAVHAIGCSEIDVIPTEDLNPPVFFIECDAEQQDFLDLRKTYPLALALLPIELQFAALLTPDYHLFAGSKEFVERAVGGTALAAYERMFTMFCAPDVDAAIRKAYSDIARYREFAEILPGGTSPDDLV